VLSVGGVGSLLVPLLLRLIHIAATQRRQAQPLT
jgi:hypothetical protein